MIINTRYSVLHKISFYPYEGYRSVTPLDAAIDYMYIVGPVKIYYHEARERSEPFFSWFSKEKNAS